jgi:hypothetical protein
LLQAELCALQARLRLAQARAGQPAVEQRVRSDDAEAPLRATVRLVLAEAARADLQAQQAVQARGVQPQSADLQAQFGVAQVGALQAGALPELLDAERGVGAGRGVGRS